MTAYISALALDFYVEVIDGSPDEVRLRVTDLVAQRAVVAVGAGRGTFINFGAMVSLRVTANSPAEWIAYSAAGPTAKVETVLADLEPL